ncbi:MAG: hypothetical protein J7501_14745 [Bdellovibrio sp.]|nr:hypothetical protein [Bdellovibrio sp.]
MRSNKSFLSVTVLWGLSLIGLSCVSHYSITGSVGDVNFEIATMLTPAGIININFIAENHYLKPYYANIAKVHHKLWDDPVLLVAYTTFVGLSVLLLIMLRKKSHG